MKLLRLIRTALRALRRNKTRALLTMLGIVIGIASVIAMMEIGQGASKSLQSSLSSMGANNLMIMPGTASSSGITFGAGSGVTLTAQDCEAIKRDCPNVKYATVAIRANSQVIYGNRNWVPSQLNGTTPDYLPVRNLTQMSEGDCFTERDVRNAAKVCLIGQTIKRELFQNESPIGKNLRINNVSFRVVGVLAAKGANMMGMDQDDVLLAPWTTIKYRISNKKSTTSTSSSSSSSSSDAVNSLSDLYPEKADNSDLYPEASTTQQADTPLPVRFANVDEIMTSVDAPQNIQAAIEQIRTVLRERHRLRAKDSDDFNIRDMTEMNKMLSSNTKMMTNLLLCVALISLVVGGVGIMNIMLVSVTERTREIGLRMAVGARGHDILLQFLIESIILCLAGGLMGIAIGRGISTVVANLLKWPTAISPEAIALSVIVAATIGIVFGFYPAWRASRLDPIEALRYE